MMRFTEILDGAFSLYRRHFWLFFWLCTLYFVCDILILIASEFLVNGWISFFIEHFLDSLLLTLMCGLMIILASDIYLGRQITLKQVIQRYLARVDAYLGCCIIYVVVLHLPELYPESETVTSIGLALIMLVVLIIGIPFTIYLLICWIFYGPVLMIENTTAMGAFGRSRYLVYGKWWSVLWNVIKLLFFMLSISLIITISFSMLMHMLGFSQIGTTTWDVITQHLRLLFDLDHTSKSVTDWIITIFAYAIDVWLTPIYAISITILYFNQRSQKMGFNKG